MNLRLRNRICPDRHIDSGTLFQYFIKLADTVTEIQNDHIIITVINDLLQKTDPLLCRGTLDILHGKYRRQIIQIVDTLYNRSHLRDQLFRSQTLIVQQIAKCLIEAAFQKIFKTGTGFQVQIQAGSFLCQDLPQRQCKCCLHRSANR